MSLDLCALDSAEIISLLANYRMLPQLWREMAIDDAIAEILLTSDEEAIAQQQFDQKYQLLNPQIRMIWVRDRGISVESLSELAFREFKIEKFKIVTFSAHLESYFLSHKSELDRAVYSLLRVREPEVAQELFFRLQAREQTFAELASQYSIGPEAQTKGMVGPVELKRIHPNLAKKLLTAKESQICPPIQLGESVGIVRLEKLIPAQLDEATKSQLLNQMFEEWLRKRVQQR
jgi:parvulin-like peptidyl-prolyl isomerase